MFELDVEPFDNKLELAAALQNKGIGDCNHTPEELAFQRSIGFRDSILGQFAASKYIMLILVIV